MNIILLSGGSGKRLWPLSNDIRSKQFIKILKTENGYESMVQRVFRQIKEVDPTANVTIATSRSQVSSIRNQLGDDVGISVEPTRRDTFPAIALAAAYLHDVVGVDSTDVVVVCPADPYVDVDYFFKLMDLSNQAEKGEANIILMGIEPVYPSNKYGYIIPETTEQTSRVNQFIEKPDQDTAEKLISKGALWNGGVFALKISYILHVATKELGYCSYEDLYRHYESFEKISFDYAVVEREPGIQVMRFSGKWVDIGSWNTLTEAMSERTIGDATLDEECSNVHVVNELDLPILAMGMKDAVISASPDGILVANKKRSGEIKKYVEARDKEAMYAEKSWGTFRVIDVEKGSLTIKVSIKAGDYMNYHSHEFRDEVWIIVSGRGKTVVDGVLKSVSTGDYVILNAGCKHTIIAETDLLIIEVQIGKDISAKDKHKYSLNMNQYL